MRNVQNQDRINEEIGDFMNVNVDIAINPVPYVEQSELIDGYWLSNGEGTIEFVPIYDIEEIEED